MARNGRARPAPRTKLYSCFFNYTLKGSSSYDVGFTKKLKKLRPDWFENKKTAAARKRKEILKLARRGARRPVSTSPLGSAFQNYKHCNPKFIEELKKIRPDWFESPADKVRKLLELAKAGSPKPLGNTKLGHTFRHHKRYNSDFIKELKKLRPDWFKKSS
jgi:hypothetical protein